MENALTGGGYEKIAVAGAASSVDLWCTPDQWWSNI